MAITDGRSPTATEPTGRKLCFNKLKNFLAEILENLENLVTKAEQSQTQPQSPYNSYQSQDVDLESHLLNRIQQYEDLRSMVKEFSGRDGGDLLREDLDFENEDGREADEEDFAGGDQFRKRTEIVDKEVRLFFLLSFDIFEGFWALIFTFFLRGDRIKV